MKSKEEIEQLASKRFTIKQFIGEDDYNRNETIAARCGYIEGYTQCQEDMAKETNNKCYHPLPYRLAKSDTNFECTLCGKFI